MLNNIYIYVEHILYIIQKIMIFRMFHYYILHCYCSPHRLLSHLVQVQSGTVEHHRIENTNETFAHLRCINTDQHPLDRPPPHAITTHIHGAESKVDRGTEIKQNLVHPEGCNAVSSE